MAEKNIFPNATEWESQGFQLLFALLNAINESNDWCYIQRHDPCILAAERNIDKRLACLDKSLDEETVCNLRETIQGCAAAYSDAAILNGIRIAFKLLYALHHPLEISQYIHKTTWVE